MYDIIVKLCAKKGITIAELERILEFGKSTILKWKESSPSLDKLTKVADYFSVSIDYLAGRSEKRK